MNLFGLWRQKCSVCSSWSRPSSLPWDSRGKYISPAPPFLTLCRAFISRGLRPSRPRRRTLSSYLSACGGQLFTARFAGCGRGPSLRCVHLRRACSSLPASAAAEPCSPFTSAARRIPRFFRRAAMLLCFTYPVLCATSVVRRCSNGESCSGEISLLHASLQGLSG